MAERGELPRRAARPSEARTAEPPLTRSAPAPRGDDLDLGTAVPGHLAGQLGPFSASLGLGSRLQLGTRVLPWFVSAIAPGSIVPNGYVKVLVLHDHPWSFAVETSLFYARLQDLDQDGLSLRAWIWPTRALIGTDWTERFSTTFELTGIYTAMAASSPIETDTQVEGVALARATYLGIMPRYRMSTRVTLWTRFRTLLGHSPVVARATSPLSDTSRFSIEARADAAELTSGFAAVAGVHLHWPWLSVTAGAGYGTWFLPWIYLPVGESTPIAELDVSYRF